MHNQRQDYVISINEQQAIQAILNEMNTMPGHGDLDLQIENILKESQHNIQQQYQLKADQEFKRNRLSIDFTTNKDYIQNSFLAEKGLQGAFQESFASQSVHSMSRKGSQYYVEGSMESNDGVIVVQNGRQSEQEIYILDEFEREELERAKHQEQQVVKLDQMYPKINHMAMYRHQYPIFNFELSSISKYLRHNKLRVQDIIAATTITCPNAERWTIVAIADSLYIFITDHWKQPKIITPRKTKNIGHMVLSPNKNYLAVALESQIIIYQIKKQGGTLVLVKNFSQLECSSLVKIVFYSQNPLKIAYLDDEDKLGLLTIEQIVLFTRVTQRDLEHDQECVIDFDIMTKSEDEGKGSFVSLIRNIGAYLALASRDYICLYEIQPSLRLLHKIQIPQQITKDIIVRWRNHRNLKNPQLFICYNNKVSIYKLIQPQGSMNMIDEPYLRMHLFYQNHYEITQMEIISETHLLINSKQNIIILAIPLIPSVSMSSEDLADTPTQTFEAALVFIYSQKNCKIFSTNYREILYFSHHEEIIRIAKLRTLQQHLDQLMISKGHYRQAFTLLILVYKGVNFSFKFSFNSRDLNNCIFSAVECTISSLIRSMDASIVQYRVAWICQLLLQTHNEKMLWNVVYKKLKQKSKQLGRIRDENGEMEKDKKMGLQKVLFDICELFVLRNQISHMPQEVFFDFISYECEKSRDTIIQKVVMNNQEPYDGVKLLSILHAKERFYLQVYLFTRAIVSEEPDYYTPFVKVFSAFKKATESPSRLSIAQKIQYTGNLCLWFLKKSFTFQQIPSGIMTLQQKLVIVLNLAVQCLQPMFTKKLSEFNLKIFLQIYLIMFSNKDMRVLVQEYNDALVQKYRSYFPNIWQQMMISYSTNSKNYPTLATQQEDRDSLNFYDFVLGHLKKTVPMQNKSLLWQQFQALCFHYCHVQLSFEEVIDTLIVLFQNKVYENFQLFLFHSSKNSKSISIEIVETELIEFIKPILLKKKDGFYMNKLLSFNDKNVSYLLHRIDNNYKLALQHYLTTKPMDQLMDFIHQLLKDIEKDKESNKNCERRLNDLKLFLIKNISLLFRIDKDDALNVFYELGQSTQTIYTLIQQNMGDKLNFLTAVLNKFEEQDFALKQKFLLDHLAEVCQLPESKMLEYLNTYYYPLDLGIIVCEQKGNLLAKAILEERCGRISEAFMSYERLVKNIIQSNSKYTQKQVRRDVQKYTHQCIRLCKKFSGEHNSEENFWLRMIIFVNGFIKSNHQHKVFLKVQFERMLQSVLAEMFDFLPTTLLIEFFTSKVHKLELSISKEFSIYKELFVLIRFDIGLVKKVIQICKIDIKGSRKSSLQGRRKGLISNSECDFCKNPLKEEEKAQIYTCEHSFHCFCHDDKFKCLTCYYQSDETIFQSNIFGTHLRRNSMDETHSDGGINEKRKGLDEIFIQNAHQATMQKNRKLLKKFDYKIEKQDQSLLDIIDSYQWNSVHSQQIS